MRGICRVIIPALNEEKSIDKVINDIDRDLVEEVIVVDNGSTDQTISVAREAGATVLQDDEGGYGAACLKGINYLKKEAKNTSVLIFLDADYADFPNEIPQVIKPIQDDTADMVIGSRVLGKNERGSLTAVQKFGNWLSCKLILLFFNEKFTDLGPFRAIRFDKLIELDMRDRNYGWTVEMQVKAAQKRLRSTEVPVSYRNRIGKSKLSGTIKGSILAGSKILITIFKNI